jgi:hypothetical protein
MSFLDLVAEFMTKVGAENLGMFSGWIVAILAMGFMVWRIRATENQHLKAVQDLTEAIEEGNDEIKQLIKEIDDVTYNLVSDSTKTTAILSEKIASLQLIIMQIMQMLGNRTPRRGSK